MKQQPQLVLQFDPSEIDQLAEAYDSGLLSISELIDSTSSRRVFYLRTTKSLQCRLPCVHYGFTQCGNESSGSPVVFVRDIPQPQPTSQGAFRVSRSSPEQWPGGAREIAGLSVDGGSCRTPAESAEGGIDSLPDLIVGLICDVGEGG